MINIELPEHLQQPIANNQGAILRQTSIVASSLSVNFEPVEFRELKRGMTIAKFIRSANNYITEAVACAWKSFQSLSKAISYNETRMCCQQVIAQPYVEFVFQ